MKSLINEIKLDNENNVLNKTEAIFKSPISKVMQSKIKQYKEEISRLILISREEKKSLPWTFLIT